MNQENGPGAPVTVGRGLCSGAPPLEPHPAEAARPQMAQPDGGAHASTQEIEAGGTRVQGQPPGKFPKQPGAT